MSYRASGLCTSVWCTGGRHRPLQALCPPNSASLRVVPPWRTHADHKPVMPPAPPIRLHLLSSIPPPPPRAAAAGCSTTIPQSCRLALIARWVQGCAGPVAHGAMPCVPSFLHCKRRCTRLLDPERLLTQTETNHSGTTEISQPIHPYRAPPTTEWMCGRTNSVARHAALMSVSPPPNRKCIAPIQSLPPSGRCSPGRAAR